MDSYQHSLVVINYASEDDGPLKEYQHRRQWNSKKLGLVMLLGVLFVSALAALTVPEAGVATTSSAALLGSPHAVEDKSRSKREKEKGPPTPEDAPKPDLDEGQYNWKKCQGSDDPDCWKTEGKRVHSYWHDFGQKAKTFWTNFGQRMRSFFGGKKAVAEDETKTSDSE